MFKKKEECDTYLTHVCRHHSSGASSTADKLMKATVLAESCLYFIFPPGSLCSSDVYRHESGRCHTVLFFLTFFKTLPLVLITKVTELAESYGFSSSFLE